MIFVTRSSLRSWDAGTIYGSRVNFVELKMIRISYNSTLGLLSYYLLSDGLVLSENDMG